MKENQILLTRVEIKEVPMLERKDENLLQAKDMRAYEEGLEKGLINDEDIVFVANN